MKIEIQQPFTPKSWRAAQEFDCVLRACKPYVRVEVDCEGKCFFNHSWKLDDDDDKK